MTPASIGKSALVFVAMVIVGGCTVTTPTSWVDVTSEYGPGMKFSEGAHTYAWSLTSLRTSGDGRPANPSVDTLIRQFVDAHLAKKGYQLVAAGAKPDFLVDYAVAKTMIPLEDFTKPKYPEGHLEITATNPASMLLIWKGAAETKIEPSNPPDEVRKRLDKIIGQVIDQLPPAKK